MVRPRLRSPQVKGTSIHLLRLTCDSIVRGFRSHARNANIILPSSYNPLTPNAPEVRSADSWIVLTTLIVLSCSEGMMGAYPVFLFTTLPSRTITDEIIVPRLQLLVEALQKAVPWHRVYSVFAPKLVSCRFTELWTRATGIHPEPEPYYAAKISFCTNATLAEAQPAVAPANFGDIPEVAGLCYIFAAESPPFTLTEEQALREATLLVNKQLVWVYRETKTAAIASIVAFTRNSESVATISKVITHPAWRRRGCAEKLVRRVCKHLLKTKESVVLYVAHENPGAAHVYGRVGFAGLLNGAHPVEGVDDWLEIGLDRSKVQLGHW
ncbi:hypothetical protein BD779DRAFT_1578477 [Infundibulicybe gibba]|nr:hypothetical protein BD779DRAFT_1578477 [Infundibulicybe gibba]